MTKQLTLSRPALTAIAAVLVLGSTPAMAQLADPAAAPPVAADPAPVAPAAPATVAPPAIPLPSVAPPASAPSPAPTIVAAPTLPDVPAASEPAPVRSAERTERATPQREARAAPVERQPRVAAQAPAAAPVVTPAPSESVASTSSLPTITPSETMPVEAAPVAAAPASAQSRDNSVYWVLGGGGALLILGAAAFAMLRRRDSRENAYDAELVRAPAPVVARDEVIADPIIAPVVATPRAADPEPVVAEPVAATPAAWATPTVKTAPAGERFSSLEAMVAEAPSAENPFLTRRKRLRRAEFLMHHGHVPEGPAMVAETVPVAAAVAARTSEQRSAVYDFGNRKPVSFRPQGWKPATT